MDSLSSNIQPLGLVPFRLLASHLDRHSPLCTRAGKQPDMTLCCIHDGEKRIYTFDLDEVIVGRTSGKDDPHVRLDYDLSVSRHHARFFTMGQKVFVEDLDSRSGVFVNHARIKAAWEVKHGDMVRVGDTKICLEFPTDSIISEAGKLAEMQASIPSARMLNGNEPKFSEPKSDKVQIHEQVDARHRSLFFAKVMGDEFAVRLKRLYDLPVRFAETEDRDELCSMVLNQAIGLVPGAERGALLSYENKSGKLRLRSCVPDDQAPLSRRLVKKAAAEGCGLIWSHGVQDGSVQSGIYAPIIWKDAVIGMVCVDSPGQEEAFDEIDMRIVVAVAHYASAAFALRGWMG